MSIFESIILGVVEGITEFLPISSTGHLILTSSLLGIPESEFLKTFEIAIQLGAILSVVYLYWSTLLRLEMIKKLIVGFIPTGIIGLALYKVAKTYLLGNEMVVVAALFFGGIALIAFEYWHKEPEGEGQSVADITYKQSALVGLFQAIAIVPGVSRSAASILGGLLLGIRRTAIVEFSFLLAVPTMLAATALDIVKTEAVFTSANVLALIIGFVTSFIVALLSIKFLLAYVRKHSFIPFGLYRILAATLFYILIIL